jgi:hypothetical protein
MEKKFRENFQKSVIFLEVKLSQRRQTKTLKIKS